jgi:complement component 1 Q subcomponent-binding protein, mitochondrial
MLSKIFSKQGAFRAPLKSVFRGMPSAMPTQRAMISMSSCRPFSTSNAATKLAKALEKELEYEKENYAELEDTENFIEESGFEYVEDADNMNCYLRKEVDGRHVEVQFSSRQPPQEPEEEGQQNEENEYDMYDEANLCDFSVYIFRDGSEEGLIFDCSTNETEITISNVMHTTQMTKMRDTHRFERSFNYYCGPEYNSLDERLQAGLAEFLQGHGVNEHLAAFVEVMSVDKDNRLYMQWLENMKKFVNP